MHRKGLVNRIVGVTLLAALGLTLVMGAGAPSVGVEAAAPATSGQRTESLVLRVYFSSTAERDALAAEFGAEEVPTWGGYLTMWVDRDIYNTLLARGYRVEIDEKATNEVNSVRFGSNGDTFYGGYFTVEEMEAFLDQKVAAYPTLAAKVDVGDSWCKQHPGSCPNPAPGFNGYDLWTMHITNQAIPGPKPVFWFDAGIHSREIATPELAMRYINWLLDGYNTNADARWLVDYHDIWVMPMLNPDGHHIVEAGGGGSNPYWQRKNANNTNGCTTWPPTSGTQFGVDLNRNFPFLWGCCGGSSTAACSQTYRGSSAGSEIETQSVTAKIRELIPDQRGPNNSDPAPITTTGVYQNMHTVAELNLYPWGWTTSPAPNGADLANIGDHMSAFNAGGNGYQSCQPPNCLYAVDGDTVDWAYGELGIPSYTTELSGGSFFPQYTQVEGIWNENRGMLIHLAKIARTPYLLTRGPDANVVATNPMTVTQGTDSQLAGTMNYNWTGNGYIQNVAAAEYYIDTPPWVGGTAVAMSAVDGNFDSPTEAVQATVATGALSVGRHIIFVRGRGINDYQGFQSWGPISAAFLDVLPSGGPTFTPTTTSTPTRTPTGTVTNTPQVTVTPCTISFTDVLPTEYFYEAVRYLTCAGVVSGYSDNTFRPYNNTTRGQMAKIVVLAFGIDIYTPPTPTFSDVPANHTFYQHIETAAYNGIVSGYADGTFRPGNDVTRGQLSKIVVEAAQWPLQNPPTPTFSDVPVGSPFYQYIETAYDHQIISGYSDGTFRPGNNATRGQIAKIVYEALIAP
jgi:carboxypeptidase T